MPRKKKDNYFGEIEEKAVQDYINASTIEEKNYIYTKYLHKPIEKLVSAIIRRYSGSKFIGKCGIEELEARAYIHVFESISGFDYTRIGKTGQPVKAYSYLGTICHNYFKTHSFNTYKIEGVNDDITAYNPDYVDEQLKDHYGISDDNQDFLDILLKNLVDKIKKEIEVNKRLKVNEIKVGESIIFILQNYKDLFIEDVVNDKIEFTKKGKMKKNKYTNIYTKNKIFYILKEDTGLNTKDLRASLMVFKDFYSMIKDETIEEF